MTHPKDINFPFTSPEDINAYLPYLITRLTNRWTLTQNQALADADLPGARMRILQSLSAFKELTTNELAALSVTEQSTTSRTVDQLIEAGLVSRHISDKDQRIRTVKLTPEGQAKIAEVAPQIKTLYESLIEGIAPEDLETCVNVLSAMLAKIRQNPI